MRQPAKPPRRRERTPLLDRLAASPWALSFASFVVTALVIRPDAPALF